MPIFEKKYLIFGLVIISFIIAAIFFNYATKIVPITITYTPQSIVVTDGKADAPPQQQNNKQRNISGAS